ncbi:MAG: GGDEF domain-containing protein, partial [Plesiomonas shigelloides]
VNMSRSLINLKQFDNAKTRLNAALPYITPDQVSFYGYMKMYMAQVLLAEGKFSAALPELETAQTSFQQARQQRGLAEVYQVKSQAYAALNDWAKAFDALQSRGEVQAELDKQLQAQRTTEMRTRFDTDRIASQNRQLLENQQLREQEIKILQENKLLQRTILILSSIILMLLCLFAFKQFKRSKTMQRLALTDHLTQLANRRHTYHKGEALFAAAGSNNPLSVIMFDADHFKAVNDFFGHEVGDKALIELAKASLSQLRRHDVVGRIGGEEFLALLPDTTLAQAMEIAERIRSHVESIQFGEVAPALSMSISAGVASFDAFADKDLSALINRADQALY